MYIYANTDRLKEMLPLLHEQRRQAKQLEDMCRSAFVAAQANPMIDASFYQRQTFFWEEKEESIIRRIKILERISEMLRQHAQKTEEQLAEALEQMRERSNMHL